MLSLFSPLSALPGIGEATRKKLANLLTPIGDERAPLALRDLLLHLPVNLADRSQLSQIAQSEAGRDFVFKVRVCEHVPAPVGARARGRNVPYRVVVEDDSDQLILSFFHARPNYLTQTLPVGEERLVSGRVSRFDGNWVMAHPSYIVPISKSNEVLKIHPVYPAVAGLGSKAIARLQQKALSHTAMPPEWLGQETLKNYGWPSFLAALRALHEPCALDALDALTAHRIRLAYDEVLAHQIMLALLRKQTLTHNPHPISFAENELTRMCEHLPFVLTGAQRAALHDILSDMAGEKPMARMLQGDVGCGKTIVAFLAMALCARSGKQALLMAPTDLLARQHMESLSPLAQRLGLTITLLTGKLSMREKKAARADFASGAAQLAVGTHALFQEEVLFHDLALVVIDEQHRFGVNQRKRLFEKGLQPHMLHMSATPIPRSLAMTFYGDLENSIIAEKPAGRQPITTLAMPQNKADEVISGLARMFEKNERAYWVCPLVTPNLDEDEAQEKAFAAAETRYLMLSQLFPNKVGLIHGQMPVKQREEVMAAFVRGDISLLVATTVIEVGINVPEATVMIIEQAERFGLAQLHQLRGRVGRGSAASHCILLYGEQLSEVARERLKIIRKEQDGFVLAEEDMRLRGVGDVLGTKQTGMPEFIFASLQLDQQLFRMAREEAQRLLKEDAAFETPRGKALQLLLRLFGYESNLALARAA